jgi:hypothetical protein
VKCESESETFEIESKLSLGGQGQFRIAFQVEKTISSAPNAAKINIYNLSKASRDKIKKEYNKITLEAGYQGVVGSTGSRASIYTGNIRDVFHEREASDIITSIECGDGDKGIRKGVISETAPANTKPADLVKTIAGKMEGVQLGDIKALDALPAFKRPVVMCGACVDQLNIISRTHGVYLTVQDGKLEAIKGDGALEDVTIISKETGMLGVPTVTDDGIGVSVLLNPDLKIGRRIRVKSQTLEMNEEESEYRISGLAHSGDSLQGEFKTEVSGEKIESGKVKEK